jgi:hypothetical protein
MASIFQSCSHFGSANRCAEVHGNPYKLLNRLKQRGTEYGQSYTLRLQGEFLYENIYKIAFYII